MEQSAMIVQTAWQNALCINPMEYSASLLLQGLATGSFSQYTQRKFLT